MRVGDQSAGTSLLSGETVARIASGALPFSAQSTIADSASKRSVAGPALQWFMPGTANSRAKLSASGDVRLQLLDPGGARIERKHPVALAVVEDDLVAGGAQLLEFRIVGVRRGHEFPGRFLVGDRAAVDREVALGVDLRRVAVEVEVFEERHQRVGVAFGQRRRRGEDRRERACAHGRDQRIVVPRRDAREHFPEAPIRRTTCPHHRASRNRAARPCCSSARQMRAPAPRLGSLRGKPSVFSPAQVRSARWNAFWQPLMIVDDAVLDAVELVADVSHLMGDKGHVGGREGFFDVRGRCARNSGCPRRAGSRRAAS